MNRDQHRLHPRSLRTWDLEPLDDRILMAGSVVVSALPYDFNAINAQLGPQRAFVVKASNLLAKQPEAFARINADKLQAIDDLLIENIQSLEGDQISVNEDVSSKIETIQANLAQSVFNFQRITNTRIGQLQSSVDQLSPADQARLGPKIGAEQASAAVEGRAQINQLRHQAGQQEQKVILGVRPEVRAIAAAIDHATALEARTSDLLNQIMADEQYSPSALNASLPSLSGTYTGPSQNSFGTITSPLVSPATGRVQVFADGTIHATVAIADFPVISSSLVPGVKLVLSGTSQSGTVTVFFGPNFDAPSLPGVILQASYTGSVTTSKLQVTFNLLREGVNTIRLG